MNEAGRQTNEQEENKRGERLRKGREGEVLDGNEIIRGNHTRTQNN